MIIGKIRATLRDPLYRHERRQAGVRRAGWGVFWAMLAALPVACCCLSGAAVYGMAALWGAEGLLQEMDQGTLEGLLLTPMGRERVLWAKLLARLRPFLWLGAFCPLLGAAWGSLVGAGLPPEGLAIGWCALIGLGAGAIIGALLIAQSLTCSAIGLLAAALGRTRLKSYVFALLMAYGLSVVDGLIFMFLYIPAAMLFALLGRAGGGALLAAATVFGLAFAALVIAARVLLINVILPAKLVGYLAGEMDAMLLRDG